MQVRLSSPEITDQDRAAVLDVLNSQDLSLGPKVLLFERAVAFATGSRYAIAVNSGTSGLHLCVKAAAISAGDEVITSPFSFVASANCILFQDGKPVFVDIDPTTYNIDPARIEDAITPRTKAILPVHVFGRPCELTEILRIANKYRLVVIEDACEAMGSRYRDVPVGSFGQTGVFAFYPNKQLTTGEGGVIVTDDPAIDRRCKSWRNQGRSEGETWLQHDDIGFNYRLSDINCALGLSQLTRLPEIIAARRRVAELYNSALEDIDEIIRPDLEQGNNVISWFVYVVRLRDQFRREDRDPIVATLRARGISCGTYFPAIHLQPVYRRLFQFRPGAFPITEHVAERTIALPFFNRLSQAEIEYVCAELRNAVRSRATRTAVAGATMDASGSY